MFKLEKNDSGVWYLECGSYCGWSQDLDALLDAHGIGVEHITITEPPQLHIGLEQRVLRLLGKPYQHLESSARKVD